METRTTDPGQTSIDERLRRLIALHFDPGSGTPYWLEAARGLGFDPHAEIRSIDDLHLLGIFEQNALANRPIEDFIPRALLNERAQWIVAETGGTLGAPRFAVHRRDEFHAAFVAPFLAAARLAGFPRGGAWLFVGPSGPHIIGQAARACAAAMDAPEPFTVDFDPRWAKKLPEGSFALARYKAHIQEQALRILHCQRISVIFSTPPVIDGLGEQLDEERRAEIRGIHFGGMAVPTELRRKLRALFPQAVMLAGYGNTLLGMAPELIICGMRNAECGIREEMLNYYPHGNRLLLRVVPLGEDPARLCEVVPYGERGQVLAHRLDETQLLLNLLERDTAMRVPPPVATSEDFTHDGIADPQPQIQADTKPALGLY